MDFLRKHLSRSVLAMTLAVILAGCGYHVGGRGTALPTSLHTIAIPTFVNKTPRYKVEQRLTEAVFREFLARTSYHPVPNPAGADAVLTGEVTSLQTSVAVFDTATGRATAMLVTVQMKVLLVDQATHQEIYKNDNFVFRQPYAISVDVPNFFDEQN